MKKTNITIFEPSHMVSEGLKLLIESNPEMKVIRTIHTFSGNSSVALTDTDILIVNPRFIGETQINKMLHEWKDSHNSLSIIALQTSYVHTQVLNNFDNIIELDDEASTIQSKIKNTKATETDTDSSETNCELSIREKGVLVLVAKGLTNKEIADQLNISIHTVIAHRKNITKKTNIKTISGLTIYALLNNLITQNEIR